MYDVAFLNSEICILCFLMVIDTTAVVQIADYSVLFVASMSAPHDASAFLLNFPAYMRIRTPAP